MVILSMLMNLILRYIIKDHKWVSIIQILPEHENPNVNEHDWAMNKIIHIHTYKNNCQINFVLVSFSEELVYILYYLNKTKSTCTKFI